MIKKCIVLFLLLLLVSCDDETSNGRVQSDTELSEYAGIVMEVDTKSISTTGCAIDIFFEITEPVSFGEDYYLEQRIDSIWYYYPENTSTQSYVPAVRTTVSNGTHSLRCSVDWADHYGLLTKGHYRLIKTFRKNEDISVVSAEFDIEE